ncbi:hypothetical protein JCGZ_11852 [Jatropha curcas]|uniref:Uncharacterized protein n=1 Tax=Jatropha curcas TaxID=180498 RepID=A0A067LNA2_JATCU|nr:hypothetical protein JCGZ_11852 [Jatropha curcas]
MGSSSDEDVRVLDDQSEVSSSSRVDENVEVTESRVGEVKCRKENIMIAYAPSDIDEGELLDICSMYNGAAAPSPLSLHALRPTRNQGGWRSPPKASTTTIPASLHAERVPNGAKQEGHPRQLPILDFH